MLADLGNPSAATVARAFGVSRSTVYRWTKHDTAPRAVALSLYWLTRWGQSELFSEAARSEAAHRELCTALRAECESLQTQLARVLRLGDFGAANSPLKRYDGKTPTEIEEPAATARDALAFATVKTR